MSRRIQLVFLVSLAALASLGCGEAPDLPGSLPAAAPNPGPPRSPKAQWSELRLMDERGEAFEFLPAKSPGRAVLQLKLADGYPNPKSVSFTVGKIHNRKFVTYGNGGVRFRAGPQKGGTFVENPSGEFRLEWKFDAPPKPGSYLVRCRFESDTFAEVPLEVTEPPTER